VFGNLLNLTFGLFAREAIPYIIFAAIAAGSLWYSSRLWQENHRLLERCSVLEEAVEQREAEIKKLELLEHQVRGYLSSQCEGLLDYINTMPIPPVGVREQAPSATDDNRSSGRQDPDSGFTERWENIRIQAPESGKENNPRRSGWRDLFSP
jgi:hypothetical protein